MYRLIDKVEVLCCVRSIQAWHQSQLAMACREREYEKLTSQEEN